MTTEDVKRKLTAILSADVQGYSRLIGDDERATVETITAYRKIMTDLIQGHHAPVVDVIYLAKMYPYKNQSDLDPRRYPRSNCIPSTISRVVSMLLAWLVSS
ncbi:MAG: adenylate cyclase [Thermodesulfobacteriota bacterium]|nr:adenylate cyclase [Thermodesulfobacteriota bacterium]